MPNSTRLYLAIILLLFAARVSKAQSVPLPDTTSAKLIALSSTTEFSSSKPLSNFAPANPSMFIEAQSPPKTPGVSWLGLTKASLNFLALEHGFRLLTEKQTRSNMATHPFFSGYADSVSNLHGFGDGDPFYVNYVGHPMQGAVAGYIWQHNDRRFSDVQFGKNRRYWKEKLRGTAFSFAYSVQFEIGPLSEASIGFIQSDRPQVGFVDHVITPSIGLAWTIGEDWLDRDVIQRLEARTSNPYLKVIMRAGTPARALANVLNGQVPWHRDDRPGAFKHRGEMYRRPTAIGSGNPRQDTEQGQLAPFEFSMTAQYHRYFGNHVSTPCVGGQGDGAFRVANQVQLVIEVGGCKALDTPKNLTSDIFDYVVGPRYYPSASSRWSPHLQFLVGGTKQTTEYVSPALEAQENANAIAEKRPVKITAFSTTSDTNSFLLRAGGGLDVKLNNAFSVRVLDVNYSRRFMGGSNALIGLNGVQVTGGMILSIGTW